MFELLYAILKTARPRQWLKNLSLFGATALMWHLFDLSILIATIKAFVIFCLLSSGAYYVNDIVDAPKDKNHPIKRNRSIASGKLPKNLAILIAVLLLVSALSLAYLLLGVDFTLLALVFVLLQLAYSFYIKRIVLLDTFALATFFVIRVLAGGIAASISISSWLFLTTIGLALLLAFGKRQSEKTLLGTLNEKFQTRETLSQYPGNLLDRMVSISATICVISYSLFSFQASPDIIISFMPSIANEIKLFMVSIPLVIYGVGRYMYIVFEKKEGESPDKVLTSDLPLIGTVASWFAFVMLINYLVL